MQAIQHLKVVSPTNEKRTVASPRRKANADYRQREHLTEREVEKLVEAAKDHRWAQRDCTMVLLAFRHGLRASEVVDLRWEQVDLENGILHVRRVKRGTPATHPLTGRELRALRRLQREAGGSARHAVRHAWLSGDGGARGQGCRFRHEDTPAHAAPCVRLQAGERRRRYSHDSRLPRPQIDPAHGPLHRAIANAIQKPISGLNADAAFDVAIGGKADIALCSADVR